MASNGTFCIGIDIGGTFTDVVLILEDGAAHVAKGLSTPEAFERGILNVLSKLAEDVGFDAGRCTALVHGTTVATNAIIERNGARTGLITTKGFRDVLELRRIRIPKLYDLSWEKPPPLVPRYLRSEVRERMDHRGDAITSLDRDSVRAAIEHLRGNGVESVAVVLLNSYANGEHERQVREIIRRSWTDVEVTVSSDVLPEMREYERTSTTVINAYIMPVVRKYAATLIDRLQGLGFRAPLLMMQSNGGAMTAEVACEMPIHIIESGPAAGVIASLRLARDLGIGSAITLDIGGTTAKASLIENGAAAYSKEYEIGAEFTRSGRLAKGGGYPLRAPTLDIAEIGAGGGSIVWIDSGGALQVGPKSAGAKPGPVCYGQGGTEPTLADACLLLGYLDPAGLAGGALPLDREAAHRALAEKVAEPLGLDVTELAEGVLRIAVSNMTRAIRSVSTERGKDPRDFRLIAFGGNGGMFAARIAHELDIPGIVIPPAAGTFSAFGLLYSDLEHHYTRTLLGRVEEIDPDEAETKWARLEEEARSVLEREGFGRDRVRLRRMGELRYYSQSHELQVPWPAGPTTVESLEVLGSSFEDAHQRIYGHRGRDSNVELVNLHLIASGAPDRPRVPDRLRFERRDGSPEHSVEAYFGEVHGWVKTPVVTREALCEAVRPGPVIVRELDTTVLVTPEFSAVRDLAGNVVLSRL